MNLNAIVALIGRMLLLLAGLMLAPAAVGFGYGEHDAALACLASAGIVGVLGGTAYLLKRAALEGKGGAYIRDTGGFAKWDTSAPTAVLVSRVPRWLT